MKKLNIKWMLSLIAAFTFASCDTDVDHDIPSSGCTGIGVYYS